MKNIKRTFATLLTILISVFVIVVVVKAVTTVGNDVTVGGGLTVDTNTLYVDATNNEVGIATSTPSYSLHVWGSAGIGTSTTPVFYVNAGDSRVGILTASPSYTLDINGQLRVVATSTLTTTTITDLTVSGASSLNTIDSGTWEGTEIGVTRGGTGLTSISQGQTLYASDANTLAATSTLFLHSNSYVGIATTTPVTLLHIYDSTATSTMYVNSGGTGLGGRIILEDNDGAGCTAITCVNGNCTFETVACP